MDTEKEKIRQEGFLWNRFSNYSDYNSVLAHFQAQSALENMHGESLLDLACGDGTITAMLARRFKRVVGVDASGKHLAEARKKNPDAEFYESLIEELKIGEKFDSIVMFNVLEHVADAVETLKKVSTFLKSDGVLIIHVPNANAINRKIAVLMGTLESCEEMSPFDIHVAGHRRSYTLNSLKEDIKNAGLSVKKTGGVFYKMLSTPQMDWFLKNGPWKSGGFGWGRVGVEQRDWKALFCKACYEIGKKYSEDCNVIYACVKKSISKELVEE